MPQVGETKTAKELGYKGGQKLVWAICKNCGKPRWTRKQCLNRICRQCRDAQHGLEMQLSRRGTDNPNWRGGKHKHPQGYIEVKIQPDDFFFPMVGNDGYIKEHRLVMAQHLGRNLHSWELVHHKDGVKDNNRLGNLELTLRGTHSIAHNKGYRDGFQKGYEDGKREALATVHWGV